MITTSTAAVMPIPFSWATARARLARIIGVLGLAGALCACNAVQLGYNNIGEVAYWWLDGYVDFTDEQSPRVRQDLRRLHGWHRAEEMPKFLALLQRMEQLAPGNITPEQACTFVAPAFERLNAFIGRAEPAIVTVALGLAPDQITHLEKKYERNNADFTKEWVRLSAGELRDKRLKKFVERAESFYGKLTAAQLDALRQEMDRSTYDPRRLLAERKQRQQDLLATLRKIAGQPVSIDDARALMRGYLDRAQAPLDPAARTSTQGWIDEGCRNGAALHNTTAPAQRESAVRRLRAYQKDLRELTAQP
jgi:hypothetical protein